MTIDLPPNVSCANDPRLVGHSADYSPDTGRIVLSLPICGNLWRLQGPTRIVYYEDAFAIFTLAHELAHAAGVVDEHQADCVAERTVIQVAKGVRVPAFKVKILRGLVPKLDLPLRAYGRSCVQEPPSSPEAYR